MGHNDIDRLRAEMLAKRRALAPNDIEALSCKMAENVLSLQLYRQARSVLIYMPMKGEISPLALAGRDKRIFLPRMLPGRRMEAVPWRPGEALYKNAFGVCEPAGVPVPLCDIDIVVAPAVACCKNGARIGHGAGYYDRYLAGYAGIKIAAVYCFQIADGLSPLPHDVAMDYIATPNGIIACKDVPL